MLLLILSLFLAFADEKMSADIFDVDGKEKLFFYETNRVYNNDTMTYEAKYKDIHTGELVAHEKAETFKGVIVRYEVRRLGTKESGVIEVKDGKIRFYYDDAGKKSEGKEDYKEPTLISATLLPFLAQHMEDLLAKKEVLFRYAVWYRKETVAFAFTLEKTDDKQIVIKMNPTNFLYRSLTKPLYFTYEKTNRKLQSIQGRTLPKLKVGSAWRDLDVLAIYK